MMELYAFTINYALIQVSKIKFFVVDIPHVLPEIF